MWMRVAVLAVSCTTLPMNNFSTERSNAESRLLGELPQIPEPVLFKTPEADAVLSATPLLEFPEALPASNWTWIASLTTNSHEMPVNGGNIFVRARNGSIP